MNPNIGNKKNLLYDNNNKNNDKSINDKIVNNNII